jgi:hypothetical protein
MIRYISKSFHAWPFIYRLRRYPKRIRVNAAIEGQSGNRQGQASGPPTLVYLSEFSARFPFFFTPENLLRYWNASHLSISAIRSCVAEHGTRRNSATRNA